MTTLTLAKLAEIEAAAAKAKSSIDPEPWWLASDIDKSVSKRVADYIALCDPATVAALCRDARRYVWLRDNATPPTLASIAWGHSIAACEFSYSDDAIDAAIRAAGLTT